MKHEALVRELRPRLFSRVSYLNVGSESRKWISDQTRVTSRTISTILVLRHLYLSLEPRGVNVCFVMAKMKCKKSSPSRYPGLNFDLQLPFPGTSCTLDGFCLGHTRFPKFRKSLQNTYAFFRTDVIMLSLVACRRLQKMGVDMGCQKQNDGEHRSCQSPYPIVHRPLLANGEKPISVVWSPNHSRYGHQIGVMGTGKDITAGGGAVGVISAICGIMRPVHQKLCQTIPECSIYPV